MITVLKPDICVIGAGTGGLSVAAGAASFGVPVVLVDSGRMGRESSRIGNVGANALRAAGNHASALRNGGGFGIAGTEPDIDFRAVGDHVRSVMDAVAPNYSAERFAALGVRVINADASFKDGRTLTAGEFEIRARRYVIATGSTPVIPEVPGIEDVDVLTVETLFGLRRRPAHLIIAGGGPVGLELAQACLRLGSRVTVVEAARALGREDPEIAAFAIRRLRHEGMEILEDSALAWAERRGKTGVRIAVDGPGGRTEIEGSHLLLALGNRIAVEGLHLDRARIAVDGNRIRVNRGLRTTNRRVYAIADVAEAQQFPHAASRHAAAVLRAVLFRLPARADEAAVPRVTFTDPEIAQVGMSEQEAREGNRRFTITRWPFAENDRAQADRRPEGMFKMITDRKERILGVGIAGSGAAEMIGLWALALEKGMKASDMLGHVVPYPTMSEIGRSAAIARVAGKTAKPSTRRLIRFLRIFG